nr:MAG TPA: hypothetical protein [Bacteriophage sp.]
MLRVMIYYQRFTILIYYFGYIFCIWIGPVTKPSFKTISIYFSFSL